ncbi:hypothetical protein D3C80_1026930 [compost metagenome]
MVGEAAQGGVHALAHRRGVGDQVVLLDDLQVLQRHRGGYRVAAGGETVAEGAEAAALFGDGLVHGVVDQHRGDRLVGRGQLLGQHHDVRLDTEGLAAEHLAGAPEAADHFVGDHQDVVLAAHLLDLGPISARRHDDAAGAHQRLADEGGDGLRALGEDGLLQLGGQAVGELLLALARQRVAVVVRAADVQEARQRQAEAAVVGRQAGEAGAGHGDAVVGVGAGDELVLLRLAEGVVAEPHQLDHGVVGLGAGVGEEHLAHRHRRHLDQLLGQLDARPVRLVAEQVVERQGFELLLRGADQALVAEAQRGAPQPGHAFDVVLALLVEDVHAFAALDDQRTLLLMLAGVGVGMQLVLDVFFAERGSGLGHDALSMG